jgi:hypothetical protein
MSTNTSCDGVTQNRPYWVFRQRVKAFVGAGHLEALEGSINDFIAAEEARLAPSHLHVTVKAISIVHHNNALLAYTTYELVS